MRTLGSGVCIIAIFFLACGSSFGADIFLSCSKDNDLYQVLKKSGHAVTVSASPRDAVHRAKENSAVLILADDYPAQRVPTDADLFELAARKHLRLYVEFPSFVPGVELGDVHPTVWERGVVASDRFSDRLPAMKIFAVNGCHFIAAKSTNTLLAVAKVAGFDHAVYGLPPNAAPLLFEVRPGVLVATTSLSNFIRARQTPTADWEAIWETILSRLNPDGSRYPLQWKPRVAPMYDASEKLPRNVERRAIGNAADWIVSSGLLISPERFPGINAALAKNAETMPAMRNAAPGDGRFGILEGYASGILHDGTQLQRVPVRADCQTEAAMVLAVHHWIDRDKHAERVARNLLNYTYYDSGMCRGPRGDPTNGNFGLIAWGDISPAWQVANYGDDNARVLLASILSAAVMKADSWNEPIAKGLWANFRTTGKFGFRGDRIDVPQLQQLGWKHFRDSEGINHSPHFESYLWACYLWAYRETGYRPFLDKTRHAIASTMKAYPNGWRWNDQIERARMILCLAWLVRVEDTPEHRQWLTTVARDMLKHQQPNGALREWLGGTGGGHYQIPQSNEAYGTAETPLVQKNGDPASDQLYTTGFALLGLREAVAATGDTELARAEDKLAEFLCRIQVRSKEYPFVSGWWFRAFDDRAWEYWASSADLGWGAWSLEAGWGAAWTAATFGLREKNTSFWDLTRNTGISSALHKWQKPMLDQ